MPSTILVPSILPIKGQGSSSVTDPFGTIIDDVPHDERQPSVVQCHSTHSSHSCPFPKPHPDDEQIQPSFSVSNVCPSVSVSVSSSCPRTETQQQQRDPILESIENSPTIKTQGLEMTDFVGTDLKATSFLLYHDDSVLTDSHESSGGSLAARLDIPKKISPTENYNSTMIPSTKQENSIIPQLEDVLIDKDDLGIPISITIFRSTNVDPPDSVNMIKFMDDLNVSGVSGSSTSSDLLMTEPLLPMEPTINDYMNIDTDVVSEKVQTSIQLMPDAEEEDQETVPEMNAQQRREIQDGIGVDKDACLIRSPAESVSKEEIQECYDEIPEAVGDTIKILEMGRISDDESSSICDQYDSSEEPVSDILGLVNATEIMHSHDEVPIVTRESEKLGDKPLQTSLDTSDHQNTHPTIISADREMWIRLQDIDAPAIHPDARSIVFIENDDMMNIPLGPELDGEPYYLDTLLCIDFVLDNGMVIQFNDQYIPSFVERAITVDLNLHLNEENSKIPATTRVKMSESISSDLQMNAGAIKRTSNISNTSNNYIKSPATHDSDQTAKTSSSKNKVVKSKDPSTSSIAQSTGGTVLARISLKSMITKKWKEFIWFCCDNSVLLIFRSKEDADYWWMNPKDKNRDILIKFQMNFQREIMARSGVRAYKLTEVKSKRYDKRGEPLFQFKIERWTDLSVQYSAAFASPSKSELLVLYTALQKCL